MIADCARQRAWNLVIRQSDGLMRADRDGPITGWCTSTDGVIASVRRRDRKAAADA